MLYILALKILTADWRELIGSFIYRDRYATLRQSDRKCKATNAGT